MVPPQGQKRVHDTHPGVSRMKALARSFVWWPHMNEQIENTVKNCVVCQQHTPLPAPAPLHPWNRSLQPWS